MQDLPPVKTRKQAKADGDKYYFSGKECPAGHLDVRHTSSYCCVSCGRDWMAAERARNPDLVKREAAACLKRNMARYYSDPEFRTKTNIDAAARYKKDSQTPEGRKKQAAWNKSWRERNPEKTKDMSARWKKANKPWVAMMYSLRACMKRVKSIKSSTFVLAALGYSRDEFKAHMESLFVEGMSWENHGEWHIDHVKPVAAFVRDGILDTRIIHALENLQPLWAIDNQKKGAKH